MRLEYRQDRGNAASDDTQRVHARSCGFHGGPVPSLYHSYRWRPKPPLEKLVRRGKRKGSRKETLYEEEGEKEKEEKKAEKAYAFKPKPFGRASALSSRSFAYFGQHPITDFEVPAVWWELRGK